jgi:hypothetical protein
VQPLIIRDWIHSGVSRIVRYRPIISFYAFHQDLLPIELPLIQSFIPSHRTISPIYDSHAHEQRRRDGAELPPDSKGQCSTASTSNNKTNTPLKSAVVVLCLVNYILIPFDTQVMKSVIDLNWPNLVAYVLIEQLFLATFRRLDFRIAGYISMVTALAQLQLRKNQTALLKAEEMGLLLPVSQCSDDR